MGHPAVPEAGPSQRTVLLAALGGALGMVLVGGSVAVSSHLREAPLLTTQGVRYAVACVLLAAFARATGRRLARPTLRDWGWVAAVTGAGLVLFNIALVVGSGHAEPAVFGVAVASVPLLFSIVGPLLERRMPGGRVVAAAALVTAGAVVVEGFGHADAEGVLWAVVILACEAGFTLFAIPILPRLAPIGVSVYSTGLAGAALLVGGAVREGPMAVTHLDGQDLSAVAYLAVGTTAGAFVLWYHCVETLGAGRAGLLTGIAPIAAAGCGLALGGPVPGLAVWVGMGVVALGLGLGMTTRRRRGRRGPDLH